MRDHFLAEKLVFGLFKRKVLVVSEHVAKGRYFGVFFVKGLLTGVVRFLFRRLCVLILAVRHLNVVREVGLSEVKGRVVAFRRIVHGDVGGDALGLNRAARGGVVACGRKFHARCLTVFDAQRDDGLNAALAEGARSHDRGAFVVLQGARDDFRGRSRGGIDENHERHALGGFRNLCNMVRRLVSDGVVTQHSEVLFLVFRGAPAGGNNEAVFRQKHSGDADGGLQKSPGVVSQIKHHAFKGRLIGKFCVGKRHIIGRSLLKLRDADVAHVIGEKLAFYRLNLDDRALKLNDDGFCRPLAGNRQNNACFGFAAHELDVLVQTQIGRGFVINLDDEVARHDACAGRRRVVNRGDNPDARRIFCDLKPQAPEFAHRAFFHVRVGFRVKKRRMGIEPFNHAFDGVFQELFVRNLIHVIVFDGAEDVGKEPDVFDRQLHRTGFFGKSRETHGKRCAAGNARGSECR